MRELFNDPVWKLESLINIDFDINYYVEHMVTYLYTEHFIIDMLKYF